MFECSACTLRALRAVAGDALSRGRSNRHQSFERLLTAGGRRASSAATALSSPSQHGGQPYLNAAQLRHINRQESDGVEKQLLSSPPERSQRRALQEEMKWLADPLKFTEHVHYTLRCDKPDKALELCRMASSRIKCVVAWNHCIDWHLKNGQYSEGLRIYNEMKKRGQFPDSYTYTILLRGLALPKLWKLSETAKDANAIKAHGIYTSMLSPTSKVQPSIIHTNAALKATAQAADLDAFWGIVAHIPEEGPGAADHISYTTILDCIRHDVSKHVQDVEQSPKQTNAKRMRAVDHGRRVWQVVVQKWRAGLIKVDEPLVGAMARLLLVSHRMVDWDDVLSLIQQTTKVQRQIAPIGSAERNVEHVRAEVGDELETSRLVDDSEEAAVDREIPADKAFETVQPPKKTPRSKGISFQYAVPGTELLYVVIEACTMMRIPKTAVAYWGILVSEFKVKPDSHNLITYVRLLRQYRASKKVAKLIGEELPKLNVERRDLYRIALEACVRDMKNKHAAEHATVVVNTMEEHLHPTTDVLTLKHFLNLGRAMKDGHVLQQVVDRLYQSLPVLESHLSVEDQPAPPDKAKALALKQRGEETRMLLQEYVGAIDVLIAQYSDALTEEDAKKWKQRRNEVTGLVGQGVDRYVAWDGTKAARGQPRKQRVVAGRKSLTPRMPRSTKRRPQPGRRAEEELADSSPFPPPTPVSRNQEFQYRLRADFDDPATRVRTPADAAPFRSDPPISFHGSDRGDHRLAARLRTEHWQQNREEFLSKSAVQAEVQRARLKAERARMVRMERWGGGFEREEIL
ncbi:hypothetical protein EJ03DRAFT_217225 [Teratosphaeria nubilosa]|uniref:Pentatricopeptide repeat protein n=1 Tax=Teratosphaeria nubilosa TaxID=161662 RepID=A0A6G1KXA5_9PEZI|nr:hypothetical protein EJ03DRAFT_217225 [Teratosphaeria nubilosa]